jgi:integrase
LRTADKNEAIRLWHELMAKDEPEPVKPPSIAVAVLLAEFAEWSQRNNRASTYEWRRGFLESFLVTVPSNLLAVDVKPFHVTKWLDQHSNWGTNSRYGAISSIKRAFQWAVDEGYLEHTPLHRLKKPGLKRRETVLTPEQRQLIVDEASDDAFRDLVTLVQETGVRPQEIRTVEARHVDLAKGVWVFPPDEHKTGGKTGKARVVFLTPTAVEVTRKMMAEHPSGPICRNKLGKPWTRNAIRLRFVRLRERLGGKLPPDLCAYHFRHSYATDALRRGVDPITVAELMGHSDATMVSRVYQHLAKNVDYMRTAALRAVGQSASPPAGT